MSIREDFASYVDGNKLLAPNPIPAGTVRGSDNGVMYTSEYFMMLKMWDELTDEDVADYENRVTACISSGMLNRAPNDLDQEGPDDYYGALNGCMELGITCIPRKLLWSMCKRLGFMNNTGGKVTWSAFLARQPQLVCAMVSSAFPSKKNPLHWLVRVAALPLYVYTALVLLVSCLGVPVTDTDSRRLAWHLGNNVCKVSLLCKLAYKVWLSRLKRDYSDEMRGVAAIYYKPEGDNPYSRWWVT